MPPFHEPGVKADGDSDSHRETWPGTPCWVRCGAVTVCEVTARISGARPRLHTGRPQVAQRSVRGALSRCVAVWLWGFRQPPPCRPQERPRAVRRGCSRRSVATSPQGPPPPHSHTPTAPCLPPSDTRCHTATWALRYLLKPHSDSRGLKNRPAMQLPQRKQKQSKQRTHAHTPQGPPQNGARPPVTPRARSGGAWLRREREGPAQNPALRGPRAAPSGA